MDPGRYCIIHPFRASWHDGTTVSGKSVSADAACISVIPGFGKRRKQKENWQNITFSLLLTGFAGIGFLINKFYLAVQYSFDTTSEVSFVPIDEIPDRFLTSIRLMLEFMGYRQIRVVTPLGIVNAVKCLFFWHLLR